MKLKDFSVEDKCKFFDYMYKVAEEELHENGEEAPNHDLGYWLRDRILRLVTCTVLDFGVFKTNYELGNL